MMITHFSMFLQKAAVEPSAKPCGRPPSTRNRIQEMRMAMKAKMAAEKEKLTAEKRHQEVCVVVLQPCNLHSQ